MGFHTSPKRKRGNQFCPSLALRAGVDNRRNLLQPPFSARLRSASTLFQAPSMRSDERFEFVQ